MLKTYKSPGVIRFSLAVNGKTKYFSFNPTPFGGSIYTTSNKAEQEALEASPHFGGAYYIERTSGAEEAEKEAPKATLTVVEVNDIDEAREYLMNSYGYSGSSLRSKKHILDAAQEKNIEFKGI